MGKNTSCTGFWKEIMASVPPGLGRGVDPDLFFQSLEGQGEKSVVRQGGVGGHCLEDGILDSSEDGWEILPSVA